MYCISVINWILWKHVATASDHVLLSYDIEDVYHAMCWCEATQHVALSSRLSMSFKSQCLPCYSDHLSHSWVWCNKGLKPAVFISMFTAVLFFPGFVGTLLCFVPLPPPVGQCDSVTPLPSPACLCMRVLIFMCTEEQTKLGPQTLLHRTTSCQKTPCDTLKFRCKINTFTWRIINTIIDTFQLIRKDFFWPLATVSNTKSYSLKFSRIFFFSGKAEAEINYIVERSLHWSTSTLPLCWILRRDAVF